MAERRETEVARAPVVGWVIGLEGKSLTASYDGPGGAVGAWLPPRTVERCQSHALPPQRIDLGGGVIALVEPPVGGVIVYEVFNPVEILGLAAIAIKSAVPSLEANFGAAALEEVY